MADMHPLAVVEPPQAVVQLIQAVARDAPDLAYAGQGQGVLASKSATVIDMSLSL